MLQLVIFALWLFIVSASKITEYGNTTGEYGSSAQYGCSVPDPTGVLQVTWERRFKDGFIENLATYSKRFGKQVNARYQGKLTLTEESFNSTSITLRNLTWEDESCYICSFNMYPDGSQRKEVCLNVKGISHVQASSSKPDEEHSDNVVFSCAAAGKPAPTIQWNYPSDVRPTHESQTTTVNNSDHTSTSIRTITLHIPPVWSGHVDCLLNSGTTGQRLERITFHSGGEPGDTDKGGNRFSPLGVCAIVGLVAVSCCITIAVLRKKRLKKQRRDENV